MHKVVFLNLQAVFVMRRWQEKYLPVYSYTTENQFTTGLRVVSYSVCTKTKLAIERGFMFHYIKKQTKKNLPTNALQGLTVTTILHFCAVPTSKVHKKMFRNKSFSSKDTAVAFDILLISFIHNLEVR